MKAVAGATTFSVSVLPDTNTPDRNLRFAETFFKFFEKTLILSGRGISACINKSDIKFQIDEKIQKKI